MTGYATAQWPVSWTPCRIPVKVNVRFGTTVWGSHTDASSVPVWRMGEWQWTFRFQVLAPIAILIL